MNKINVRLWQKWWESCGESGEKAVGKWWRKGSDFHGILEERGEMVGKGEICTGMGGRFAGGFARGRGWKTRYGKGDFHISTGYIITIIKYI
ncbi:hypothetical protein IJI02_00515 [Candidatus Saccharibacteria bacterium]|nr:hypothetical protein [Candidatus Saccharibacteria bacterium]